MTVQLQSKQGEAATTEFGVRVTRLHSGYDVYIWEHLPGKPHKGLDFAKVHAHHLDVALKMAVPYMASAAEPDPFAHLLDRPAKQGEGRA